jgi:hypothetical protein
MLSLNSRESSDKRGAKITTAPAPLARICPTTHAHLA